MDVRKRRLYINAVQKKKLIEFITKHPLLISCKLTPTFTYKQSQMLWRRIANELNTLPGAQKTWRQWKKTWQDLRSKTKKRSLDNDRLPASIMLLSPAEKKALGIKQEMSNLEETREDPEFVALEQDSLDSSHLNNENESTSMPSEPESPPEMKVFLNSEHKAELSNEINHSTKNSIDCYDLNTLAAQELKKLQLKEDFINFKKDYLRQKLQLMREQTEALKNIAKEMSNFK